MKIQKRFENGAISFKSSDGRLIKITAKVVDDLMGMIRPEQTDIRIEQVEPWHRYWTSSDELVAGPDREQESKWSEQPNFQHVAYCSLSDLISILGILHGVNLDRFVDFTLEVDHRITLPYRKWAVSRGGGGGYFNPDARSKVNTTIVSQETWDEMTSGAKG